MEKAELWSMVKTGNHVLNQEMTTREETDSNFDEQSKHIFEAHERAVDLATQLLDHYNVPITPHGQSPKLNNFAFGRYSPAIPLGEVDPNNPYDLTYGFISVSAEGITKVSRRKPSMLRFMGVIIDSPNSDSDTEVITRVGISLFNGLRDGTTLMPDSRSGLGTENSVSPPNDKSKRNQELAEQLRRSECTVDILEFLVADLGLELVA